MVHRRTLLAALLAAGCAVRAEPPLAPVTVPFRLDPELAIEPELLPALEAIEQALRDGDDEVARHVLERLLVRQPEGRALELARGFQSILDGRETTRALDLCLVAEERAEAPGSYVLALLAAHPFDEELRLRPGAARLRQSLLSVEPEGGEQRAVTRRAVDALSELRLPAGETARFEFALLEFPPPPRMLALRARLELELLSGTVRRDGRELPAQELPVAPVELVRLAGYLPYTAIEPAELARYALEERIRRPALMERAVRIAPARRAEALDMLAARAGRLSLVAMEDLVPALRWLAGTVQPGGDPEAWRSWLLARAERRAAELAERGAR